jgi:hypothetical protein
MDMAYFSLYKTGDFKSFFPVLKIKQGKIEPVQIIYPVSGG